MIIARKRQRPLLGGGGFTLAFSLTFNTDTPDLLGAANAILRSNAPHAWNAQPISQSHYAKLKSDYQQNTQISNCTAIGECGSYKRWQRNANGTGLWFSASPACKNAAFINTEAENCSLHNCLLSGFLVLTLPLFKHPASLERNI